jgi:hypothetical protein
MRRALIPLAACLIVFIASAAGEEKPPVFSPQPNRLKTLVNPDCSHCIDEAKRRAADLRDDDRVLCWIRGKYQGGAIPYRFYLNPYRVISDTYGVFVYDADAGFVRGFEPSLDFTFHGWRNGVMVIQHKDGTLYSALSGIAFDGPNKGKSLKPIPTLETAWGYWLKVYKDTVAYKMYDRYQAVDLPKEPEAESLRTRPKADPRLPAETPVLGIRIGTRTKAYPLEALAKAGVINEEFAGQQIAVFWHGPTRTAVAYRNSTGAPFALDSGNPLAPFQSKTNPPANFDLAGRLAGSKDLEGLEWIDGVQVKWFAWAAEFPDTVVPGAR